MDLNKVTKPTQILRTAKILFMQFGFKRVSVEEICRTANVSKMTFYKYFANKTELIKALIEKMMTESIDNYHQIMARDVPYPEKVKSIIDMKLKISEGMGVRFFEEYLNYPDSEIRDFINEKTWAGIAQLLDDFYKARAEGNIRANLKPEFIIYFLNKLIEMAGDQQLIQLYDSPNDVTAELINFFFYGILPRN